MQGYPEKRSVERQPLHQPVSFERSRAFSGEMVPALDTGQLIDITASGAGFTTDCELMKGEVLRLYLPVASTDITVPVFSEIVWTDRCGSRCRAGLRFLA